MVITAWTVEIPASTAIDVPGPTTKVPIATVEIPAALVAGGWEHKEKRSLNPLALLPQFNGGKLAGVTILIWRGGCVGRRSLRTTTCERIRFAAVKGVEWEVKAKCPISHAY